MDCRHATPVLLIVAALTRGAAAVPQLVAVDDASSAPLVGVGHMSRAFQLSCHSSGDAVADLPVLTANLAFVQGVCCSQLEESCGLSESLPTSCGEPACARVVELVSEKCGPLLSNPDCFYCGGFKEALDSAVHVCAGVHAQRTTYTMADPTLRLSPIVVSPGRLTDGMSVPDHWTATGQERVTIRAPTGQRVRFLLEAQWFGSSDVLILYDGNKKLAEMRGTKLPADPLFISSGEEMGVLLVTAEVGEGVATSFSALFDFICEDDVGCGGHGQCTEGRCDCRAGYFGDGCEDDSCAVVDCGAHGVCERGGTCRCADGYTWDHCGFKPDADTDGCLIKGTYMGQTTTLWVVHSDGTRNWLPDWLSSASCLAKVDDVWDATTIDAIPKRHAGSGAYTLDAKDSALACMNSACVYIPGEVPAPPPEAMCCSQAESVLSYACGNSDHGQFGSLARHGAAAGGAPWSPHAPHGGCGNCGYSCTDGVCRCGWTDCYCDCDTTC
jgi:hypothetical protein